MAALQGGDVTSSVEACMQIEASGGIYIHIYIIHIYIYVWNSQKSAYPFYYIHGPSKGVTRRLLWKPVCKSVCLVDRYTYTYLSEF